MSVTSLLMVILGFLVFVIVMMLVGFIIRELSFSRQLDAIRQILMVNAETSAQIVELVESSLQTVTSSRDADAIASASLLERVKDMSLTIQQSVIPVLSRLEGASKSGGTHNSFIANPQGTQVNAGVNTNVDQQR